MIRRDTEEAESLPDPPASAPLPKPTEEPEWREELNRKIAGYRERSSGAGQDPLFDDKADETAEFKRAPVETRPSSRPKLPPIREAGGQDLPPPRAATDRSILPPPPSARTWKTEGRRVKPSPAIHPPIVDQREPLPARESEREPPLDPRDRAAPISLRLVAGLMDVAIVAAALGVFAAVCMAFNDSLLSGQDGLRLIAIAFALLLGFYWFFYLRFLGRTAGMSWLGLRVLNFDGELPDEAQRRARALGTILSAVSLGIGFAWAAADEGRLTWHDRISKTFVALDN